MVPTGCPSPQVTDPVKGIPIKYSYGCLSIPIEYSYGTKGLPSKLRQGIPTKYSYGCQRIPWEYSYGTEGLPPTQVTDPVKGIPNIPMAAWVFLYSIPMAAQVAQPPKLRIQRKVFL